MRMREIKFRGRHIETGEWIYGNLIGNDVIVGEIVEWDDEYFCTSFWYKVDPETVGQYAGRKTVVDEKEIYQGDILSFVRASYDGSSQGVETGYVEWSDDASSWIVRENIGSMEEEWMYLILHNDDGVEIIGNIYDHPHLLKGE